VIISAVSRGEFISERMLHIILWGQWRNINILNVRTPCEDKSDDAKNRYDMKVLLGDIRAKVVREDTFKLTIGNGSSHKINNDNRVRVVNFATSKNLGVKSTLFPHQNIHKYTWTSPARKMHN
jgi:hypothetical protein